MSCVRAFRAYLNQTTRPLLVGPWHSELGFEALYWEPFLAWLLDGIPKDRIYAITRGGAPFYRQAVDLFDFMTPEQLRAETFLSAQQQSSLKQYRWHRWERDLVSRVTRQIGLSSPIVVHPSWMYQLFDPVWKDRAPLSRVFDHTLYRPLAKPERVEGLPPTYYAVKFYARPTFQMSPQLRLMVERIVDGLLARAPVVCLNSSSYDDHMDLPLTPRPGLFALGPTSPAENLKAQMAALAHACGFIGPYGGVQQAALRYGVPSMGLYGQWSGTMMAHRFISESLSTLSGVPFDVQRLDTMRLWSTVHHQLSSNVGKVARPDDTKNSA